MAPDEGVTAECVHEVLVVGPGIRMSLLSLCNAMVRMLLESGVLERDTDQ